MEALLKKIPPADLGMTKEALTKSMPSEEADKLSKEFPVPFDKVCEFGPLNKEKDQSFIMCPYNKVADGEYRSPWTNNVYTKDGKKTTTKSNQKDDMLLELEKKFNSVWQAYANLYYGASAVSSVYLGETESKHFQAIICIAKDCDEGSWNGFHIVQMDDPEENTCQYHVTSHVWVKIVPDCSEYGGGGETPTTADVSAYMTKSVSKVLKIEKYFLDDCHMQNIGTIVEANEIEIRSSLEQVDLPKTKDIMDSIQKEPEMPRQVNPLMGMIMDSNVLKKKKLGQKS